ncbi:MAG: glycosyltransferase family 4 protein [Verrucomicrobia bacterium]|nr:glycosyltransferase family 4 protein [Verrucomicrobiota bacterium]
MRAIDRVYVCTHWAQEVLLNHGLAPATVRVVPLGVDGATFSPGLGAAQAGSFETLFVNVGKFELRKGQDVLVEAFNLAFEPKDPVRLLVHGCNNLMGENYNRFWIDHCKSTRLGDKITLVERPFVSHREVAEFMAQADCGVFPARAEGWNLELLEMMALGKTVIATAYGGHTEFANQENCLLIKVTDLEDAQDGVKFTGQGQWAHLGPDQIEQLVVHLRAVHQRKQSGKLDVNSAGIVTAQRFTWQNAAAQLVSNLGVK